MNLSTDAVIDILKSAVEFLNEKVNRGDTLTLEQIKSIGQSATLLKNTFQESFETFLYEIKYQCLPEDNPNLPKTIVFDSYEKIIISFTSIFLILLFVHIVCKIIPDNKQ